MPLVTDLIDVRVSDSASTFAIPPFRQKSAATSAASYRDLPEELHETNLPKTLSAIARDYALITVGVSVGVACLPQSLVFAVAIYLAVIALIASRLRGLECLVHEGAHFNWTRRRRVNDAFCNVFAAFAVFSRVQDFRGPHGRHHDFEKFCGEDDPDAVRNAKLDAESIDRSSIVGYVRHLCARIGPYAWGWWCAIGTRPATLVGSAAWHLALVVLLLSYGFDARLVAVTWLLYFAIPFLFALPVVRYIAEMGKHPYGKGAKPNSWFEGTISNLGVFHRLLIHPHADGYHLLHHLDPRVPHHQLAKAHAWLIERDAAYARLLVREHVLEEARANKPQH